MKRRFTILTAALVLLAFLAFPMGMMGQTSVIWPGTTALPGTATAVANDQNITIMVSTTNTYTDPIRIYANTTVTIDALNNAKILSVAYEASSTGNYVTNAQNATVTPEVTPTVSGKIVTWTYSESENVTEFTFTPSAQTRSNGITITYITTGATPTCATPTFSPAAGTYTQAQNVSISCATEDATIYYTTNGDDPTTNSTVYTEAISVSSAMTIKAMAAKSGFDNSAIATAEYAFITLNHAGTLADPYTVADAHIAIDANAGTQGVYATGIVSAIPTAYNSSYGNVTFNMVDEEGDEVFLQAFRCTGDEAANVAVGDVAVVYGNLIKYGSTYEFGQGCQLVSLTHPVSTEPSITVTPTTVNAPAEGVSGNINVTCENLGDYYLDAYFYASDGVTSLTVDEYPDWIIFFNLSETNGTSIGYSIDANSGDARTAYFKVIAFYGNNQMIESALVTVSQAEYVAPTYAVLPFAFNGGRADIEDTDGLYQEGLGSDYNANSNPNTQLKFDGTGDWLVLQFDEDPGILTFDIKGNGFSGGTFTVQASVIGGSYNDLAVYTELGDAETKTIDLTEYPNYRNIKWIYTAKSSGNVGLGNINLAKPVTDHTINLSSYLIEAEAEGGNGELNIAFGNWPTATGENMNIQYYDAEGEETTEPEWMMAEITTNTDGDLVVSYLIDENDGEARNAYFKVYALDDNGEDFVYSALVTVNQAAYVAPVLDYAELPFEFDGGRADIENTSGLTQEGLDSDYSSSPKLKFNTTGDWLVLHFEEEPGVLTFDIKGNGFSDGTFTVQACVEGGTYNDLETYTELGTTTDTKTIDLTDYPGYRYIRWIYIEKVNGNVALGNINLAKPVINHTIDLSSYLIEAEAEGGNGELNIAFGNWPTATGENMNIQYYDAEGEETTEPEWMMAEITTNTDGDLVVSYLIDENDGEARNAYFKVYALDDNGEDFVYSALVTVNQAAYVAPVTETYTLNINGYAYDNVADGYFLIASPVTVDPATVEGMTAGAFDLYSFDEGETDEWRNYEATAFNLVPGKGYLYAKKATTEGEVFSFTLTGTPYNEDPIILSKTADAEWSGLNLVGNPFNQIAYIDRDFYTMSASGDQIVPATNETIQVMEGIFVYAETDGEEMQFSTEAPAEPGEKIIMNVTRNRGNVIDRAIVRFGEGRMLPKFQLNENSTKIYMTEGNQDFAIVRSANEGEMPVNFKASENGNYTLSVNAENIEMEYLHLIDNMTGADVDLLSTPSYSFEARTTDYASRFRLVFSANSNDGSSTSSETFAFFNGSNWVINNEGEATLEVIDMMGRVLGSEQINGSYNKSLNLSAGVYVLRLSNGNAVKTQKVVID